MNQVQYQLTDKVGHKHYGGFTVGEAVTMANVRSFVEQYIIPYSDCVLSQLKVTLVEDDVVDLNQTGEHPGEFRGTTIVQDAARNSWPISIPGIIEGAIDPNGSGPWKLLNTVELNLLAGFTTLTTKTGLTVKESFIKPY